MPTKRYTVRKGDCLSTIAARSGLPWKALWDHPDNAGLRRTRKDPNVLRPGDVVAIPEVKLKQASARTGGAVALQVPAAMTRLRVRLMAGGKARASKRYTLVLPGGVERTGATDADGYLDERIPASAREITVKTEASGLGVETLKLKLGHLDPAGEPRGAQQRLRNLGFPCEPTGEFDAETRASLARFQEAQGLEVTAALDTTTIARLEAAHGA